MDTRVAPGAAKPLIPPKVSSYAHGEKGLDIWLPGAKRSFDKDRAWDVLYDEAVKAKGEMCLIAIGPLTNVAITLFKYPDIKDYIKQIVIMGGSTNSGNASAYGEFNIYADPHAADVVFQSGISIKMVGLNATEKCALTEIEAEEIFSIDSRINAMMKKLIPHYIEHYNRTKAPGMIIHDAITLACVIDESMVTYEEYPVSVETKSALTFGRTVVDNRPKYRVEDTPNAEVAIDIDKKKYIALLKQMMCYYK